VLVSLFFVEYGIIMENWEVWKDGDTMLDYAEMSLEEVRLLDPGKTIFFLAVSPIEAHGPHLPLGTDVFIAQELQQRYARTLGKEYPGYTLVRLPPLFLGADALPVKGSLSTPASLMKKLLLFLVKGLAAQGFRYLFLSDNHGGPRHQLAIEQAARKAWKRHRFYLINPFGLVFRLMVQHDPDFLEETGLQPGSCGDDADSHAGTNETSLMLACHPGRVKKDYQQVPDALSSPPARFVQGAARLAGIFSGELQGDLEHLSRVVGWVSDPDMLPYMGKPALASREAGEAMLQARVKVAMHLFQQALEGKRVEIRPMLWKVRFLQYLPE